MTENDNYKVIAENRKARFNYQLMQEFEAGIMLTGTEVKSLRTGGCNINDAFAQEYNGELFLHNANITIYKQANRFNHEPLRLRKLLLKRKELNKIIGQLKVKGTNAVPTVIYFNHKGLVKLKLALAKGKKEYEKRDSIATRDWQREKERIFKDKW